MHGLDHGGDQGRHVASTPKAHLAGAENSVNRDSIWPGSRTGRRTPPPGGVDAEQMNMRGSGVRARVDADRWPASTAARFWSAAIDVAADESGVVGLQRRRPHRGAAEDRSPQPGAKRSSWARIVSVMSAARAVRGRGRSAQAVCSPPACGCRSNSDGWATSTKACLPLGSLSRPTLAGGHFSTGPAQRTVPRRAQSRVGSWDRSVQRQVHLEDARPVAERRRRTCRPAGRRSSPAPGAGPGPAAAPDAVGARSGRAFRGPSPISPQRAEVGRQRIGDPLRAAARNRPSRRHARWRASERAKAPVIGFSRRTKEWAPTPASMPWRSATRKRSCEPGDGRNASIAYCPTANR